SANRAFRQLFGLKMDEIRHRVIEQILPSDELIENIRDMHVHGTARPPFLTDTNDRLFRIAIVPIRNWNEDMELETLLMIEDLNDFRDSAFRGSAFRGSALADRELTNGSHPNESPAARVAPVFPVNALPAVVWQADAAT